MWELAEEGDRAPLGGGRLPRDMGPRPGFLSTAARAATGSDRRGSLWSEPATTLGLGRGYARPTANPGIRGRATRDQ